MRSFKSFIKEEKNPVDLDVWHGAGKRFSEFKQEHSRLPNDYYGGGIGYFTSDKEVAKTYANAASKREGSEGKFVYNARLRMNNVFDVDHEFSGEKLKSILPHPEEHENFARSAGLMKLNGPDKHTVLSNLRSGNISLTGDQVFRGLSNGMTNTAKARDHLISKGYDGLRYNGGVNMDEKRHDVYIPYASKNSEENDNSNITIKKRYVMK